MKLPFQIASVIFAGLFLTACEEAIFDNEAAQGVIEAAKIPLGGEQVILTPEQITCGEKKGLWEVDQIDGAGAIGRLTDAGRKLEFGDDIRMGDRRFSGPYTQLSGSHSVKVQKVTSMVDENPDGKVVTAKLGVVFEHECFTKPVALLGIDRGDFSEDAEVRVRLRNRGGWKVDSVLH